MNTAHFSDVLGSRRDERFDQHFKGDGVVQGRCGEESEEENRYRGG